MTDAVEHPDTLNPAFSPWEQFGIFVICLISLALFFYFHPQPHPGSEGIAGAGAIRTACQVYLASHNNKFNGTETLEDIGICKEDLEGKMFKLSRGHFKLEITPGTANYIVTAIHPEGGTYALDQDGNEVGSYIP